MTVLTEISEKPCQAAETLRLLDIQIFTAAQRVSAQAGPRQKRDFPGDSDGKWPDSPAHRRRSGFSKPNDT